MEGSGDEVRRVQERQDNLGNRRARTRELIAKWNDNEVSLWSPFGATVNN